MEPIEQRLFQSAGALVLDGRLLRRIIKAHRGASGIVPHARCYAISRADLLATGLANELPIRYDELPDPLIAVARPAGREARGQALLTRLWRGVVHARVHVALEEKMRSGALDQAALRERIDRVGQIEFDEVRAILRHDDMVLPSIASPAAPRGAAANDDREVYSEFCALYLELRYFAPGLLVTTFPGIGDYDGLDAMFAADLDIGPLLDQGRPAEVDRPTAPPISATTTRTTQAAVAAADVAQPALSPRQAERLLRQAGRARAAGNDVRAALLSTRAASALDQQIRQTAQGQAREAIARLGERLNLALCPPALRPPGGHSSGAAISWSQLGIALDRATADRAGYAVEARLLYALQLAALAHERVESAVDLAGWILSRGKRKAVRPLPATREIQIARRLGEAAALARHSRLPGAERKLLCKLCDAAEERAEDNVRAAMRPALLSLLDRVGLRAASDPERLSRDKLVEELCDAILEHGYLNFGLLRDALSRNQLKLPDLSSAGELWRGDALLQADRILGEDLDGLYRPSDVYLRGFQKLSSLPFGTKVGRAITLYFALPVGAAAIVLETARLLGEELSIRAAKEAMSWPALGAVSALVFGLIHSPFFRKAAMQLVEVLGVLLALLFVRLPRAVLSRPTVRRVLALPEVRLVIRRALVPAALGALVWRLAPWGRLDHALGFSPAGVMHRVASVGISVFAAAAASAILSTPLGVWLEDVLFDQLAPGLQVVSRQVLPGLFRLIGRFFAALMDLLERAMVRVDEALRFRQGQSQAALYFKAGAGLGWSIVAYGVRFYVTLMIEPFINPLKHFPVVIVADKLLIASGALFTIQHALEHLLRPLGPIVGGGLAVMTAFLTSSLFGFVAWELKENYKLYGATRAATLTPAQVGHHGETVRGLLVVGMHSGTLPKLYERLRRAAQREDEAAVLGGKPGASSSLGSFREGLHEVEHCVRRFVDRELCALIASAARWPFGPLEVSGVELSSNRVRIRLRCPALSPEACEIAFEEQSGLLVAGIAHDGFLPQLQRSADAVLMFENALAGLYHKAEVDLVREQIEAELGHGVAYDIADRTLVVWPGQDYKTELSYRLTSAASVAPKVTGAPSPLPIRVLDTRNIHFRDQAIGWLAWVSAWSAAAHPQAAIPRLVRGTSILPGAAMAAGAAAAQAVPA